MTIFKDPANDLKEKGCYSMKSFLSDNECATILSKVKSMVSNYNLLKTHEYEELFVANHTKKKELPGKLTEYPKPVIVTRGLLGNDKNMTEIFSIDKLVDIPKEKISGYILETMKSIGFSSAKIEYSCYINKDVQNTRGFHRDIDLPEKTSKRLYKMFVYLTDVPDYSYGPHSYIIGSHTMKNCNEMANHLVGNYTDPSEYDANIKPHVFTGKAGTMIMTCQSGLHRGLPQIDKKERIILVCKIRPN